MLNSDTHGPFPFSIENKCYLTSLACKDTGRIFISVARSKSETAASIEFRLRNLSGSTGDTSELRDDSTKDYC